jgi:hypothetical protein
MNKLGRNTKERKLHGERWHSRFINGEVSLE